jgi:hypothetical protein
MVMPYWQAIVPPNTAGPVVVSAPVGDTLNFVVGCEGSTDPGAAVVASVVMYRNPAKSFNKAVLDKAP